MRKTLLLCILLFSAPYPFQAFAACQVDTAGVVFSPYDDTALAPTDTVSTVTVSCDEIPPPVVDISIGPSPNSGSFSPRSMRGPWGDLLTYNLYTDATYSSIWGDGTNSTSVVTARVQRKKPVALNIYGRIPPQQSVSAGNYNDALVVTLNW
jgi:spore coat protein U-like protein